MFCKHCGTKIDNDAKFCINCGTAISNSTTQVKSQVQVQPVYSQNNPDYNTNNSGLNVLSFLLPIIGLILYIVYSSSEPVKARGVGKWALIGFMVGIVGYAIIGGCTASMY